MALSRTYTHRNGIASRTENVIYMLLHNLDAKFEAPAWINVSVLMNDILLIIYHPISNPTRNSKI